MPGVAAEPEDQSVAIEGMLEDGAPAALSPGRRRSRWLSMPVDNEPSAEERAALRRAARRVFRLYCLACGRSSDVLTPPARPGRCEHCGGTMLIEAVAAD